MRGKTGTVRQVRGKEGGMSVIRNADAGLGSQDGESCAIPSTSPQANPTSTSLRKTGKSTPEPAVMQAGVLRVGVERRFLGRWRKRG